MPEWQLQSRERFIEEAFVPRLSQIGEYKLVNLKNGKSQPNGIVTKSGDGFQYEKRCWDVKNPGPPYKSGGTFFLNIYKRPLEVVGAGTYRGPQLAWQDVAGGQAGDDWRRFYYGGFADPIEHGWTESLYAGARSTTPTTYNNINPDDLTSLGSRAYAKLRPKVEIASLAQSIFEAKEIPQMLKTTSKGFSDSFRALGGNLRTQSMTPKGVADHFLNVQFGWKPFLKDFNSMLDTVKNFDVYVERTKRNNNTWLKRYWAEDEITSGSLLYSGTASSLECTPPLTSFGGPNQFLAGPCSVTIETFNTTRVWHVGRFKFYRPEFAVRGAKEFDTAVQARQMTTLLGLNVNPTLLYKVTPWTWLVDWFINVGDNVQRFEDMVTDAVVSKYFYTMREIRRRLRYRIVAPLLDGQVLDLQWYREAHTKRRSAANSPFSFTLLPGGLSAQQFAILGALGLTKLAS